MAPKIFLTGVTGYIGGDAFYALEKAHPDFEYTLLVRSEERAKLVKDKYPNAKFVFGTLDSSDAIEKAAAEADVVVHTANSADDMPSAKAIAKGLAEGHTVEKPGYWIHISGTGILQWYDEANHRFGQPPLPQEKYDDMADIDRLLDLPDEALHRDVDKVVLAAASATTAVRPAIVAPPTIYGRGRGPGNQRSIQVYEMARAGLQAGAVPYVGTGRVEWDNVHVHDLSALLVALAEAALDPAAPAPALFGPRAYFFVESGSHAWGDVARWVAEDAHRLGLLPRPETRSVAIEEAANRTWGANSKSSATRARKYLGWRPSARSLRDEIPDIVRGEAEALGMRAKA